MAQPLNPPTSCRPNNEIEEGEIAMKRAGMRIVLLAWTTAALLAPVAAPSASAAFRRTVTSQCGACGCTGCFNESCQCLLDPDGTATCNIDCVLCDPCFSSRSAGGVAGGGAVRLDGRQATVALLLTTEKENQKADKTTGGKGLFRWVDPDVNGGVLTLESLGLTDYRVVDGQPNTREARGLALANGEGPFRFVVQVVAAEGEGDSVKLLVGDAADGVSSETGFNYSAEGPLVAGDLVGTWTPPAQ